MPFLRGVRRAQLAAADELHDFDLRSRLQRRRSPLRALDDATVKLDGQTFGIEFQIAHQAGYCFAGVHLTCVTIHYDGNVGGIGVLRHGVLG